MKRIFLEESIPLLFSCFHVFLLKPLAYFKWDCVKSS